MVHPIFVILDLSSHIFVAWTKCILIPLSLQFHSTMSIPRLTSQKCIAPFPDRESYMGIVFDLDLSKTDVPVTRLFWSLTVNIAGMYIEHQNLMC